jgi:RNA processing factor Prp31
MISDNEFNSDLDDDVATAYFEVLHPKVLAKKLKQHAQECIDGPIMTVAAHVIDNLHEALKQATQRNEKLERLLVEMIHHLHPELTAEQIAARIIKEVGQ